MKLYDLVETYINYKHSLGMRFRSQTAVLRAYSRVMGDVSVEKVVAYLAVIVLFPKLKS